MSDPLFDKVVSLLLLDGTRHGTSLSDVKGHAVNKNGKPTRPRAQATFET